MPTFAGISMTIGVNGADVPEYMVEEDVEKRLVACWIPSEEFEINAYRESRGWGPWAADVYADGRVVYGINLEDKLEKAINIGFFRESPEVTRALNFSRVELVDDDELLHTSNNPRIGEIEVKCVSLKSTAVVEKSNSSYKAELAVRSKLHEKAKKGISQHIGAGRVVELDEDLVDVDTSTEEALVTFIFRYRTLGYLQAQGIVPPTPAHQNQNQPDIKPNSTKPEDLSEDSSDEEGDEEIRELQRKLDEAKNRKRTRKQGSRSISKRVKQEEIRRFLPGEVIDLT